MLLSPSEEARQAFLGGLFGTFELSPKGHGEKAVLKVEGGNLEVVGTGVQGKLKQMALKLLGGGVQVDGILLLVPTGDETSWAEAKSISHLIQSIASFRLHLMDSLEDLINALLDRGG